MNCPHCGKTVIVKLAKDSNVGQPAPQAAGTGDLGALLDQIDDASLTGKAAAFVTQTRERFEQYGSRTRMSEKQMEWLRSIANGEAEEAW